MTNTTQTLPAEPGGTDITRFNALLCADAGSHRSVYTRISNYHPVAIQAVAKKLVSRSPQIQPEAPIVEFAEALNDECPIGIKVPRPLLEGEEIAVAVAEDLKENDISGYFPRRGEGYDHPVRVF